MFRAVFVLGLFPALALAAVIDQDAEIKGNLVEIGLHPDEGGTINKFGLLATPGNLAGPGGLLLEGFGVGSHYVPNRRLNERLEALEEFADRPVLRYSYDCDGPNIRGLKVTRQLELLPDEASIRVTWTVQNAGNERQWVAPWIRNDVTPGGSVSKEDRLDVPLLDGVVSARRTAYAPASRNWIAATDPIEKETLYAVFNAEETHSFLTEWDPGAAERGFTVAFVPRLLEPGGRWSTVYRLNAVRGLSHVNFATDEFAMQLDVSEGRLVALLSAARSMRGNEIHARVAASDGQVWTLPAKRFDLTPTQLARCTWDWLPPADGVYDFLAQIRRSGAPVSLGGETASPHGGIDTQFTVGKADRWRMEAWTDAPHALDRGPRKLKRTLAASGDLAVWFEPSLDKIFREDTVEPEPRVDPTARIALAKGERESFQIALRPAEGAALDGIRVAVSALTHRGGTATIPASDIAVYNVAYHPVRIPSYFEGPTGRWPDALPPHMPFSAPAGMTTPVWVTVHARASLPAGIYSGVIEISAPGRDPQELFLEARIFDFALPDTPALSTDFGFSLEAAQTGARAAGGNGGVAALADAYLANALDHRVTLRDLAALPSESADYARDLAGYAARLKTLRQRGATAFSVPASLLSVPEQLKRANAFVVEQGLEKRAFVHLADEPEEPAWPRLFETMQQWKDLAPNIPIMITTKGLAAFIPEVLDRWAVHTPVLDTVNGEAVLQRIRDGHETWWYVSHAPPRPYANFFLDFAAVEHRILFWQTWAAGMRGIHYWAVNYAESGQDPWTNPLDITPVNGDGLLVYPGPDGPINSIRWEIVRDGIEDYDYLSLVLALRDKLLQRPGNEALLKRAAEAVNLLPLMPSLADFTRDSAVLLKKRLEIAETIEAMMKGV